MPLLRKFIFPLIIIAFFAEGCGEEAYLIDKYDVSVNLVGDTIHEKIVITLSGAEPPQDYVYLFAYPLRNVSIFDEQGALTHTFEGEALIVSLRAKAGAPYAFTMEFDTEGYVQKMSEDRWVFSPIFTFDVPVRRFSLTVSVPSYAVFEAPIHPNPTSISFHKDALSLRWEKENLAPGEEAFIIVNFKRIATEKDNTYLWISAFLFGASFFFATGFFLGKRKMRIKEIYFVGDEKVILDVIKEEGGKVIQSTLTKKTDFSKAKISKMLADLEQRGIIQKDKYKRTNVIILKEGQ